MNKINIFFDQELQLLGYSNICPNEGNFDVISLINCTWTLLQNYRSTLKNISDLEAQVRLGQNNAEPLFKEWQDFCMLQYWKKN